MDLAGALRHASEDDHILIDCATLWLSNVMLAERSVDTECAQLMTALRERDGPTVIVSNETGLGIVPEHRLGRDFRNAQGRLNQSLAEVADVVVLVVAGRPLALKGDLP